MTTTHPEVEKLSTPAELGERFGMSVPALAQMRYRGTGPRFIKFGKQVRYRESDIQAWLDQQTRDRT